MRLRISAYLGEYFARRLGSAGSLARALSMRLSAVLYKKSLDLSYFIRHSLSFLVASG